MDQCKVTAICNSNQLNFVAIDLRRDEIEICEAVKGAFRIGNVFIHSNSDEDVSEMQKRFQDLRLRQQQAERRLDVD